MPIAIDFYQLGGLDEVTVTVPQSSGTAFGAALSEGIARIAELADEQRRLDDAQRRLDDAHRRGQQSVSCHTFMLTRGACIIRALVYVFSRLFLLSFSSRVRARRRPTIVSIWNSVEF